MPTPPLPTLTIAQSAPRDVDVLVVGLSPEGAVGVPTDIEQAYANRFAAGVGELARSIGAKPEVGSRHTLPAAGDGPRVVVVGVGSGESGLDGLRQAAGTGVRQASSLADDAALSVAVSLGEGAESTRAIAEGALLGSYHYATLGMSANGSDSDAGIGAITVVDPTGTNNNLSNDAQVVARAVVTAREWVNSPPNLLYPASFADDVRALVRSA